MRAAQHVCKCFSSKCLYHQILIEFYFLSQVNKEFFTLTGVDHRITSKYHPHTNGLMESFNPIKHRISLNVERLVFIQFLNESHR